MSATARKERPILFRPELVRKILDGTPTPTQTRRLLTPQPNLVYGVTGDRIVVYGKFPLSVKGVIYEAHADEIRRSIEGDTRISERRLHGGRRWSDLFTDEVCRIWQEGSRGVVSARWPPDKKEVHLDFFVPQQFQGHEDSSFFGVLGVSRDEAVSATSSSALGRESAKQQAGQPPVGNTERELGGSRSTRTRNERRETSDGKTNRRGAQPYPVGGGKGHREPEACREMSGDVARRYSSRVPWRAGETAWVRETWNKDGGHVSYLADGDWIADYHAAEPTGRRVKWRPSIHMPREACRLFLEITDVRVERVQDISEADAVAEGMEPWVECYAAHPLKPQSKPRFIGAKHKATCREAFEQAWDATYPGSWERNDWVWVISFRRTDA